MTNTPAQVTVAHILSGVRTSVTPRENGFLGSFTSGDLVLEIKPIGGNVDVIRVNQEKKIGYPHPDANNVFRVQTPLLTSKSGLLVTKFPSNHVKLVKISRDTNYFKLWEVAIVAQSTLRNPSEILFFLTEQQCYFSLVYRNAQRKIVMPNYEGFSRWRALQDHVETILGGHDLPNLPLASAGFTPQAPELDDNEGEVDWYSLAQGLGPIWTNQGMARVHWSAIIADSQFRYLKPAQRVTFERLVPPKNTQNKNRETKFEWDAEGVKVIN